MSSARMETLNTSMPTRIRKLLLDNLEIGADDLTVIDGPLGLGELMELLALDRPDLKDPPFVPRMPPRLRDGHHLFASIRKRDLLTHQPYDSFNSVLFNSVTGYSRQNSYHKLRPSGA